MFEFGISQLKTFIDENSELWVRMSSMFVLQLYWNITVWNSWVVDSNFEILIHDLNVITIFRQYTKFSDKLPFVFILAVEFLFLTPCFERVAKQGGGGKNKTIWSKVLRSKGKARRVGCKLSLKVKMHFRTSNCDWIIGIWNLRILWFQRFLKNSVNILIDPITFIFHSKSVQTVGRNSFQKDHSRCLTPRILPFQ